VYEAVFVAGAPGPLGAQWDVCESQRRLPERGSAGRPVDDARALRKVLRKCRACAQRTTRVLANSRGPLARGKL